MRRLLVVMCLLGFGCGDNLDLTPDGDGPLEACLDHPETLDRPPAESNTLPCELLPPGFVAAAAN